MGGRRRESYSIRAFAVSVGWIIALLVSYWVLSDWQAVPRLFSSTIAAIR